MSKTFYIASKAKHRPRWRKLREQGVLINSRWIDTDDKYIGTNQPDDIDYSILWKECIEDVTNADYLVLYVEAREVLKGALIEVGVALSQNKVVLVFGDPYDVYNNGSWPNHPLVTILPYAKIEEFMRHYAP